MSAALHRLRDIPGWAAAVDEYRSQINPVFSDFEYHLSGELLVPIRAVHVAGGMVGSAVQLVQTLIHCQTPRRRRHGLHVVGRTGP